MREKIQTQLAQLARLPGKSLNTAQSVAQNLARNSSAIQDVAQNASLPVALSMVGPAVRGFLLQNGKKKASTLIPVSSSADYTWTYTHDRPELEKLYRAGVAAQWDSEKILPWQTVVDPYNPTVELFSEQIFPIRDLPQYRKLPEREKQKQRAGILAWMLSQFLHGEQGALYTACQVTQNVSWFDGKLYGSTQVIDEGRHVEVFHRYLTEKLGKLYEINDNLYVLLDALMTDSRWDIKFLGMQIMIEGLALGAFGTMRTATREPLLQDLLKYVILDEGRHVHFGVVALKDYYTTVLPEKERQEREDWAFEMSILLRNRFLAHEFYDEFYGHALSRKQWDEFILSSAYMDLYRSRLFYRLIPNLKKIGLLTDRIRPHYEKVGLLQFERGKAANELSSEELLTG
jgi:hypothetical protein